jgi:hypothetical protein
MEINFNWKRTVLLSGCSLLLLGAAAGCGSKPAAAPQQSATASTPAPASPPVPDTAAKPNKQKGEKKRTKEAGQTKQADMTEKLKKTWVKKGASAADADQLSQLVKSKHIEAKWVTEQLDVGRKAADIESDIQSGKAPVKKKDTGSKNKPEAAPAS